MKDTIARIHGPKQRVRRLLARIAVGGTLTPWEELDLRSSKLECGHDHHIQDLADLKSYLVVGGAARTRAKELRARHGEAVAALNAHAAIAEPMQARLRELQAQHGQLSDRLAKVRAHVDHYDKLHSENRKIHVASVDADPVDRVASHWTRYQKLLQAEVVDGAVHSADDALTLREARGALSISDADHVQNALLVHIEHSEAKPMRAEHLELSKAHAQASEDLLTHTQASTAAIATLGELAEAEKTLARQLAAAEEDVVGYENFRRCNNRQTFSELPPAD